MSHVYYFDKYLVGLCLASVEHSDMIGLDSADDILIGLQYQLDDNSAILIGFEY